MVCPECGAPHHRSCYHQNKGCAFSDRHSAGFHYQAEEEPPHSDEQGSGGTALPCRVCGAPVPQNSLFCPRCGTPANAQVFRSGGASPFQANPFGHAAGGTAIDPHKELEDGVTVSFTMAAFNEGGRRTRIMGTDGELFGRVDSETVEVYDFKTRESRTISFSEEDVDESINGGHGGGDDGIVNALYAYLSGEISADEVSEIGISYRNHLPVFAAEKSRRDNVVVDMEEFRREIEK